MTDIGLIIAFIFGCLTIYYTLRDYRKGKITKKNYLSIEKLPSKRKSNGLKKLSPCWNSNVGIMTPL